MFGMFWKIGNWFPHYSLGLFQILDSSSEAGIAETQNAPATTSTCNDGLGCSKTRSLESRRRTN